MNKNYLLCADKSLLLEAHKLVNFTKEIILVDDIHKITTDYYLSLDSNGLYLCSNLFTPLLVNDIYIKLIKRVRAVTQELLYKAVYIKNVPNNQLKVLDVTAGLGKDSLILILAGFNITMVECNPILSTILYYAILKNYLPSSNCRVIYMNSINYLKQIRKDEFNVIYLDPMFNQNKSAKAKKEMQLIQMLVNDNHQIITNNDTINHSLFNLCYSLANKLVIKRDNKQISLVNFPIPSYIKQGKTIRYDIYNH